MGEFGVLCDKLDSSGYKLSITEWIVISPKNVGLSFSIFEVGTVVCE